ncbi:glycosyltransferase family 39 protein [Nitrosomonas sp.]|uniref:ArnT family glycosyltransferase n=1 Tax=Nitrosomonas sp. TaxID=42353 RepID=UPI0027302C5A|nr:hypothetical protein [Nitrosomonas sp.]MDP1787915.1 hypothetical protein [Nitrosomonas sp.]
MENLGLKFDVLHWERTLTHPAVAAILLAVLCLGLHYSALSGGWRYDDGAHLYFTALYSPWQYFFVPEIMRAQSWANFTPWNAFFYEIGLLFFDLNPTGFYAHLLLILWSTAVATFFLLRLWLTSLSALMGAILFLAMPVTGAIGQMLMTGHYAYGLLFSVLTFYFFARGVRENRIYFSLVAAGFYALACWSKELYVPIIAILIFLPESNWKVRFRHTWPAMLVAAAYIAYRLIVHGGIGGYGIPLDINLLTASDTWMKFFSNLFGGGWVWKLIFAYVVFSIIIAITFQNQRINLLFLLSWVVVIFIPILPVLQIGFSGDSSRFLFFISWLFAVLLAWLTNPSRLHTVTLVIVVTFFVFPQKETISGIANTTKIMEEQNRFLLENSEEKKLLPLYFNNLSKLDSIRSVNSLYNSYNSPDLIRNEDKLSELGDEIGSKVFQFNDSCQCIQQMGKERYRNHVNSFHSQLAAGADQFLSVELEVENRRFRKLLRWKFSSSSGSEGNFILYINEYGMIPLSPSGEMPFGLDITVTNPLKQMFHVYVHLVSPEGWIARSPLLTINPAINNKVSWSGKSAVDWSLHKQGN